MIKSKKYLFLVWVMCICHFTMPAQDNKVDSVQNILKTIKPGEFYYDACYDASCYWALAGNKQKAFEYLEVAIDSGFIDIGKMQVDPRLNILKNEIQWTTMQEMIASRMKEKQPSYLWGAYFGILLILFFYNLFLFFSLRENQFLYYSLFVYCYAGLEASRTPQFYYYVSAIFFWISYIKIGFGIIFFPNLLIVSYLLFTRSFLNLEKYAPTTDKWMKWMLAFFVPLTIATFFIRFNSLFQSIDYLAVISTLIFIFSTGINIWLKKLKEARFFVLGNVFLISGSLWTMLYILKITFSNKIFVFNSDNIGIVTFMMMLSFALGDKMNILKKEKINAQAEALEVLEERVEERTLEIVQQKALVEEKNKDILDSINYAKRLQDAILPPLNLIREFFQEAFVLYKPKDIVAGDFYWMERAGHTTFIAAADCTGHGVPGALVSVVCSNALNRTVKEFHITETGKILDKVRELVLETFEKSESNVQDGMDISLFCINSNTREIHWSGAYNSLLYVQNNEMHEVDADKQPIGKVDKPIPFTTHILNLQKGDILYLFTDGYADQFGGPKGKKFRYKRFQEMLLENAGKTMDEQKNLLEVTFAQWKGNLDQVDDILVIGIKV